MKKHIILFAVALVIATVISAPISAREFSAVDTYVDAIPKSAEQSVSALAEYLSGVGASDLERARALFRWLTQNIDYNVDGLFSGSYGDLSPEGVLRSRKAVCSGYSRLAKALGSEMGLEVEEVVGWSKGYDYTVGQTIATSSNHAWNAVRIDGEWQLMDPTWGAGGLDSDSQSFLRSFNEHYFLTDPEEFVFDHFPDDQSWQLLSNPITLREYADLPYPRTAFFANNLEIRSHDRGLIKTDEQLTVTLGVPDDVALSASLLDASDRMLDQSQTFIETVGGEARINAAFPEAGSYTLRVFAKPSSREGSYSWAMDYRIQAARGDPDGGFYTAFGLYYDKNALLYEPLEGTLNRNKNYRFKIRIPDALKVAVVVGEEWVFLERGSDDIFTGEVVPSGSKMTLYANFVKGNPYQGLVKYKVH